MVDSVDDRRVPWPYAVPLQSKRDETVDCLDWVPVASASLTDLFMKLRIGLIGLGEAWQTRHRPALRMLHDRFDVRAVFTAVGKLGENCAREFQADIVDGYRALVQHAQRIDLDFGDFGVFGSQMR